MRLIDADALKIVAQGKNHHRKYIWADITDAPTIEAEPKGKDTNVPTVETEPVRRGKWIDENCSECGQYVYHGDARRYCPNCGAKMETADD